MALGTKIEALRWHIRDEDDKARYASRDVLSGMPQVSLADLQASAEQARVNRARYQGEFELLMRKLIGGDPTFGGGTASDPHPSKRKGTGVAEVVAKQFLSETAELPEFETGRDPGSVLNQYSATTYGLRGDAAVIMLNPELSQGEKDEKLFPILVRLEVLTTKEEQLRDSLRVKTV